MEKVSVVICAYNPNRAIFERVIDSLQNQTLEFEYWELLIIDNNSSSPISDWLTINWHPQGRIISEIKPGLINARNRGTIEAKYDYIISVDDDTLLCDNYLELAQKIYTSDPNLGIIGGRSTPIYLEKPPKWISQFNGLLAIRDLGEMEIVQQLNHERPTEYPTIAPILIAPRKKCMEEYISFFENSLISKSLGRKGSSLASGEDNDINMFIYAKGYKIGYFPDLKFEHIIPAFRTTKKYLVEMAYESNRSWVKMLTNHGINPWKKIKSNTVLLRQAKAFFTYKAWKNTPNYIKWRGACGKFKGLSEL
ncbi:glycosyltransferase [Pedobacter kyonggii]|uniref:Glycosyltransferase family 2 protein n=1 Tax=Pedobacter kyonggii TaxID=1926871 RepID=A0A4Q9HCN7_9SPHI|nr:glycosyltransferase [Pedobacter kyonggii]TBO42189.1 glycosyltransferase family 2 protein [Pedobacter kyonggii]